MTPLEFLRFFLQTHPGAWSRWEQTAINGQECHHPEGHSMQWIGSEAFRYKTPHQPWKNFVSVAVGPGCVFSQLKACFDLSRTEPLIKAVEIWMLHQSLSGDWILDWRAHNDWPPHTLKMFSVPDFQTMVLPLDLRQPLLDLQNLLLPQRDHKTGEAYGFSDRHLRFVLPSSQHERLERLRHLGA